MDCKDCLPLIPGYVDQELSEAQSAPLRQHLMDCPACRKALSGQKSLERWFASPAADLAEVPAGFAQRVARRAFAGDRGELATGPAPQPVLAAEGSETPIYSFVLWATAAAAGLLLVVSGMLFQVRLGDGDNMHAGNHPASVDEILDRADELSDPSFTPEARNAKGTALEDMSDVTTKRADKDRLQSEDH